ncbi:MAG: 2-phytyl-1,4-beta-naphthoquinone methyltransferase, chloroplastic [Chroococcidiopsis sp. SAG 2025]|uniref:class I SAM-dependent methyltransferase n=1 Tax=Chroococcidiopsis sp. SAG 2025 TaxID=171389 RepID=UPI0029370ADC|nr:class I SAM-dependent methyltransferase [Chroococcidiopsis sp. SAG 2025]MDV2994506.1 2-phytyl-1,4-beta-naphthoquinone methyltransferase, chloroplastic [Chroococcidiopsis sp. SAG 2025]
MDKIERLQTELQNSYDLVAEEYARQFYDELDRKPFDRKMLDWFIDKVDGVGTICDLGCGSGHIANYLHDRDLEVCGVDLSLGTSKQAQKLNPNITFQQGDMISLNNFADNSFGGIAAFYSIIHVPRSLVADALREMQRVLRSRGVLLLTFHIGQQTHRLEEWFDKKVFLDFHFFETAQMKDYLLTAGFELEEAIERDPYPDIEVQTRRAYLFAKKP